VAERRRHTAVPGALLCFALGAGLTASGCGDQKKIKECNALIGVINAGVEKVQKGTAASPDGGTPVSELRALADGMDVVVKDTEKLELSLGELKQFAQDYKAMTTEIAAAARELAIAVDAVDMEKLSAGQARMEAAVKREDPLVDSINKFCQTP